MEHVHAHTPSHPRAEQMQYWPPHHALHHIHMNPPQPPVSYDYPPWHCNFGYSSPMICHNCGSNSYATPHYFWRPPYSYNHPYNFPVPPQYTPPLNYQTWYDYLGKVQRENHHCCGCPNNLCSRNETGNVKIEEEGESNRDCKNGSMIPYQFQSWPSPFTWNSPRDYYIKGVEHGKNEKSGMNGFRNLGSSNQKDEGAERNRQLRKEDGNDARFPFPLIWMPYEPEENENNVHNEVDDTEPKAGLETIKDAGLEQDIKVDRGKEHHKEKEISPMKNGNLDGERDSNNTNGAKRQSTTKSKSSSKLPPVCLRVDPLPKRKIDNGSGRSSTPSGNMKAVNPKPANTSSGDSSLDKSTKSDDVVKSEVKKTKGITKTIQVTDGTTTDGVITVDKITTKPHHEDTEVEKIPQKYSESLENLRKLQSEHPVSEQVENNAEVMKSRDATKEERSKPNKRELTSEEAAVAMQSAYRGFDVRRWEPLKKLKQIAKVREEIAEVKNLIQKLELSSDVRDIKQRTIISERIMSLLLNLDTIQGLHPSIRDARKSVVRELVTLQEKLDALANEQIAIVDEITPSREGNLPEAPENYVDEESRPNNLGVLDNGGGSELSNENLGQVVPEPLVESSNICCGTEPIIGNQDRKCETGEEAQYEVSVVAKDDDHEELAIPQTSDLSSDQVKDLEQVDVDERSGLELRVDAHGDEVNKEHVAVDQVSDGIFNEELMPENIAVDNSTICEDADFVREEEKEAIDANVEGPSMHERTVNESTGDNKVDDLKNLKNDDSLISDSPNTVDETADMIIGSNETSEDRSEDVKEDSVTCLARKEEQEDHLTGDSILDDESSEVGGREKGHRISNDVPIEVREEEKCCIIYDDIPSEIHEEEKSHVISEDVPASEDVSTEVCEDEKSHSISDDAPSEVREEEKIHVFSEDVPTEVCEEEKSHSISEDVPSKVHEQEEKNCSNSDNVPGKVREEEERSVEVHTEPVKKVHEIESKNEDESHGKVSDNLETINEGGEKVSEHIKGMTMMESNKKLIEENEKLREMMEKLIKSGQDQLNTISNLSCRIKDLEKRVSRKKRAVKMTTRCGGRKQGSGNKTLVAQSHNANNV